jgi:hypothetical protein
MRIQVFFRSIYFSTSVYSRMSQSKKKGGIVNETIIKAIIKA